MYKVKQYLQSWHKKEQTTLNSITIDSSALLSNLSFLQSLHASNTVFPTLKSNAYGHGLKEVSTILKNTNVPYICVDSFPEYQIVRDFAQKKSLIMGETHPDNYTNYDPRRATVVIYNIQTLKSLIASGKKRTIHLFLNTGMNREGIQINDIKAFFDLLETARHILLEGVMSHFANADETDASFDMKQMEIFKKMYTIIQTYACTKHITYLHINNSAGTAKYNDPFFNAHRAGIAFYGYNPLLPADAAYGVFASLQPALTVSTTVIALQKLMPNEIVSYGGKRTAGENSTTATLPFGYYEGLSRKLINNREVKWKENYLPLIGTICMNLCCFNATNHPIQVGDTLEVISANHDAPNSIMAFAKKTDTIHYEVLVKLNEKIKRIIV